MNQRDDMPSAEARSLSEQRRAAGETAGAEHWRNVLEQPRSEGAPPPEDSVSLSASPSDDAGAAPSAQAPAVDVDGEASLAQLLRTLTYAAAVVGLPLVGGAVYANYQAGRLLLLSLWVVAYLPLLLPLLWVDNPYVLHAAIFVGSLLVVGFLSTFQPGFQAVGVPVLLCLPAFATVLLGRVTGRLILAAAVIAAGAGGWLSSGRSLARQVVVREGVPFPVWWAGPAAVLLLGGGLVLAASRLRGRIASLADEESQLTSELRKRRLDAQEQGRELTQRRRHLETIGELGSLVQAAVPQEVLLDRVLQLVPSVVPCYAVRVFLQERGGGSGPVASSPRLRLYKSVGPAPLGDRTESEPFSAPSGVVAWVGKRQEPCVLDDVETDERYVPQSHLDETRSEAAFPLIVDSQLLGVLDVHASHLDAFSQADLQFLRALRSWIALALDHRRLAAVPSTAVDALSRAAARLCAAATKADVADAIVDTVAETRAGSCLVAEFVRDPDSKLESLLCLRSWRRHGGGRPAPGTRLPVSSALFPVDLLEGTWVVPDAASDERLPTRARALFSTMGVQALVGFPLQGVEECLGQVLVLYGEPGPFSDSALHLYGVLEDQAGLAMERAARLDEAYQRAKAAEVSRQATARLHESLGIEGVLSAAVADIASALGLAALDVRLGPPTADGESGDSGGTVFEARRGEED